MSQITARLSVDKGAFKLDAQFQIPARGISALFGPSGCGKTTLLRAMAGLEPGCDGFLQVGDQVWQQPDKALPAHQRPLGYVFQDAKLFPHLSVIRNLEYGYRRLPESARRIDLQQAIDWLGIGHLLQRRPDGLSGGEKQRVAIARALLVSPRLMLMDEPLASLDEAGKQALMPYLETLHRELDFPVIYVSHSQAEVARLAQQLIFMQQGRVVDCGDLTSMFTRLDLPLAHDIEAAAVLEATVRGVDEQFQLSQLDCSAGQIQVAGCLSVGERVRLRLAARDVSLTLEHQRGTSILNILPATVQEVREEGSSQVIVRLLAGEDVLLSRITRKSASELGLNPGKPVYAQVKSVALLG